MSNKSNKTLKTLKKSAASTADFLKDRIRAEQIPRKSVASCNPGASTGQPEPSQIAPLERLGRRTAKRALAATTAPVAGEQRGDEPDERFH